MVKVKRGEIYMCDLGEDKGSIQGGYRPVLVVQANKLNEESSIALVAPLSSVLKRMNLYSHIILNKGCGLDKPSVVLLEQIRPVNISELSQRVGEIKFKEYWRLLNTTLRKTFGLWHYQKERTGDVRCLCHKHLQEYKMMPEYIVKRFEPTQVVKDTCDKCNNLGYDYLIFEKEDVLKKRGIYYGK